MENHAIAVVNKNPARQLRGAVAREHWRKLIVQQQASGETVAAWCRRRGIWAPSWFAWRRKLNEETNRKRCGVVRGKKHLSSFIEVKLARPAAQIEIRLDSGRSVLVRPGFDAAHLRAVMQALEAGQ